MQRWAKAEAWGRAGAGTGQARQCGWNISGECFTHHQRERKAVEAAVCGVVHIEPPGPRLDQPHQGAKAPVVLQEEGGTASAGQLS